ncbi:tetratricopeptide repeat protein [Maribacter sp. 2307UL18-2]|uniref:tetratricopeptide repeat protein n=1 Tax=Maribacter sp. 2307UL18-2 TaxID=3386274 RepID=UPI0039BD4783
MNRLLLFLLVLLASCKDDRPRTDGNEDVEVIFHDDGRVSVYLGENNFKRDEARQLNAEGVGLAKDAHFQKAKHKFLLGLEIEPENSTLLNNLGNTEHELKNYHQAIIYFEHSLKVSDSSYLNASLNLGLLYWKDYEFKKSTEILEYVLLKSDDKYEKASAHYQLAKTYLDMNKCGKAQRSFSEAKLAWKEISGFDSRIEKLGAEIKNCVQHNLL